MTIEWLDKHISNSVKPFVIELCVWKTWEIVLNDCWKLYNQYRLLESTTTALRHMTYGPRVVNRKFIKTPCLQRGNVGKEPAGTTSLYNKHCCCLITHILLRRQIYSLVLKDKDKDLFIDPQEFVVGYSKAPEQPQSSARPICNSHTMTSSGHEPATIRIAA